MERDASMSETVPALPSQPIAGGVHAAFAVQADGTRGWLLFAADGRQLRVGTDPAEGHHHGLGLRNRTMADMLASDLNEGLQQAGITTDGDPMLDYEEFYAWLSDDERTVAQ